MAGKGLGAGGGGGGSCKQLDMVDLEKPQQPQALRLRPQQSLWVNIIIEVKASKIETCDSTFNLK